MKREQILLDPTAEISPEIKPCIERPISIAGLTAGLLDINKPRGDEFLDRLESLLSDQGVTVKRYVKERFSKIADGSLLKQISDECDIAIEALAD